MLRALAEGLLPDELTVLGRAFDGVCAELRLDRQEGNAAQREYIAKLILKLAGIMDEATLHTAAIADVPSVRALQP